MSFENIIYKIVAMSPHPESVNTLRQNGCHFVDDIFKCIFLIKNPWVSNNVSLNFVPKGPIHKTPSLVQAMTWHWPGTTS